MEVIVVNIDIDQLKIFLPYLLSAFLGGLFGGFFALLFGQLGQRIKNNRERWARHHNALVRLELICNDYFDIISVNKFQLKKLREVCASADDRPKIMWSRLADLPDGQGIIHDLLCLELKNAFYSLQVSIRRHNHDVASIVRATFNLQEAFMSGRIQKDSYILNMRIAPLDDLQRYFELIEQKVIRIRSMTGLQLKHGKRLSMWRFLWMPSPVDLTEEEIKGEENILKKEIAEVAAESRKNLNDFGIGSEESN